MKKIALIAALLLIACSAQAEAKNNGRARFGDVVVSLFDKQIAGCKVGWGWALKTTRVPKPRGVDGCWKRTHGTVLIEWWDDEREVLSANQFRWE